MKGVAAVGLFAVVELPTLLALIALVVTIGWLLWRSHRYLARQEKEWSPPACDSHRERRAAGSLPDAPDDVARWEVQMHETARDLSGQLDTKMSALSHLIREADRAAGRLEAALSSAPRRPDQHAAPDAAPGQPSESLEKPAPLPPHPTDQAAGLKSAGAADRGPAAREATPTAGASRLPADERYEEIYLLADYGFDAAEIAHRVGTPIGEVELILGLRRKQK